ncbi:MAG: MBL fold metallo-hydrolase [Proteobacteria bacterium]|nr:MBL fold metallo-hydrolase [Pseudomonadota bacterium]
MRAFMLLITGLALAAAASAQEQDFSKVEVKATRVAGNVYLLEGAGGNIAASVGEDGIVLVDDEFAPLAPKIAAALKSLGITDKPVRYVINTHYHFDHTGGNAPFAGEGSTVIAHDNVRTRMASGGTAGNGGSVHMQTQPAEKAALPVITFDHDVSVHLNGEDIRALHFPAGHTDGDAVIYFPRANVVHMGDDYVRYGFPFIDVDAGGSAEGMIRACEAVIEKMPPDVKIIPGHGALSTVAEMREYVAMLKATSAAVSKALKAGQTLEQMKAAKLLAPWSKYSGDFITTDAFLETLYNAMTKSGHTPFVRHN